ncbi:MAG: hypothetical protein A2010_13180 [Nitrospirae bacterium GWD2_57_9]|nr:MAG: hypothetical protein A2010_13180 [Nitrospirae bacterium GWD2_57_9]OGW46786.1 MAG: hypothetical protein A2078_08150 [Nitrospirae bacterium GWC2_57_9]
MNHVKDEKSLGSLFSDLTSEMQRLVRDEITLLKSEMSHKITRGAKDLSFLAIGAAVLYAGLLAVVAAAVFLLALAIPIWISALIVGAIVLGIGYFLIKKGMADLKQTDFTPRETISTLKGDKEWLKKRT